MINDDIVALHELRKRLSMAKNLWNAKAAQFDIDNKELKESAASLAQQVAIAEAELRKAAVDLYEDDALAPFATKDVAPGIKIQDTIKRTVEYEESDVLPWAKEKDLFLALDRPSFDVYALKAKELPDCVKIVETRVIKATVATDLFKAVLAIEEAVTA